MELVEADLVEARPRSSCVPFPEWLIALRSVDRGFHSLDWMSIRALVYDP